VVRVGMSVSQATLPTQPEQMARLQLASGQVWGREAQWSNLLSVKAYAAHCLRQRRALSSSLTPTHLLVTTLTSRSGTPAPRRHGDTNRWPGFCRHLGASYHVPLPVGGMMLKRVYLAAHGPGHLDLAPQAVVNVSVASLHHGQGIDFESGEDDLDTYKAAYYELVTRSLP